MSFDSSSSSTSTSNSTSTPLQTPKKDLVYATVQHYEIMYTTELQRSPKNRIWHDGTLTLHLLNGRMQLSNLKEQKLVESWFHTLPQGPNVPRSLPKQLQRPLPLSDREGNRNQRLPVLEEGLEFELQDEFIVQVVTFKKVSKVDVTFLSETRLSRKTSCTPSNEKPSNPQRNSSPASRPRDSTPASHGRLENSIRAMPLRAPSGDGSPSSIVAAESSFNADDTPIKIAMGKRAHLPPFKTPARKREAPSTPSSLPSPRMATGESASKRPRLSGGAGPRLGLGRVPGSSIIRPSEEAMKRATEMEKECEKDHASKSKSSGRK